ncbi:MAG: hypothetical protein O9311_09455 [Cytophagales bacterium]|nr:hypothetical protein [Cytophagales bacterium]
MTEIQGVILPRVSRGLSAILLVPPHIQRHCGVPLLSLADPIT